MLRSKSPLVDNREIVMMLLHFAVTFCHVTVTMSFYEDKYCRLLGPFYINYKSRVHQSYHLLVIVLFIFLSERLSIALSPQCPVELKELSFFLTFIILHALFNTSMCVDSENLCMRSPAFLKKVRTPSKKWAICSKNRYLDTWFSDVHQSLTTETS